MDESTYDYCVLFVDRPSSLELAQRLIGEVSSYKLPKKGKDFSAENDYKKGCLLPVLSEKPLEAEQLSLLQSCRWLMVICTRQDREAYPVRQAINYFNNSKGRAFILPVLLEGEPQEAFPPEFFEERIITVTFGDGTVQKVSEVIEPLAIDVRAHELKASISLLKHVKIKIVAALIGVSYDTLEQRHERRARRRLRILATVIILVPVVLGSVFTYLWLNSESQIKRATEKTQISKDLLASMCQDYPDLFKDIPEARPVVNALLVNSLEKLRVAESEYIPLLNVEELLLPNDTDDLVQVRNKAKILRYIEKKEEAAAAYEKASSMMESNNDIYMNVSRLFTEETSPEDYPCGILVVSIKPKTSKKCDGLQQEDIIVEANGFKFRDKGQFEASVFSGPAPDETVKLTILRPKGKRLEEMILKIKPEDLKFESEEM